MHSGGKSHLFWSLGIPYGDFPAVNPTKEILPAQISGYVLIDKSAAEDPTRLSALRLCDDSMIPTLPPGSVLVFEHFQRTPVKCLGHIVCTQTENTDEVVVRRLVGMRKHYVFVSDNRDQDKYPPLEVSTEGHYNPLRGKLLWAWIDFR